MKNIFLLYIIIINITGFFLMFADKRKAIKGRWRIPEKTLFLTAILGGSVGSILGMYTFRHKTKHLSFVLGMPAILVLQFAFALFLRIVCNTL